MTNKKYNKVLTIVFIIVVAIIFILLGFWGYDTYRKYYQRHEIDQALNEFNNQVIQNNTNTARNEFTGSNAIEFNVVGGNVVSNTGGSSNNNKVVTYKGFTVMGTIEIPAIDLEYPILERATKSSLEASIGILAGPGLNQVGNTVLVGHNFRNGTFFSRNEELKNGDLVYITDSTGNRVKYTIYNIYQTSSDDADYITRDTAGKREISLSTCTDDTSYRLVIWARED